MGLGVNEWLEWLAVRPRVGLGTAQLGLPYGVANRSGMPSEADARALLRCARDQGIRYFDTARAYGQSEERLGRFIRSSTAADSVRIISKLSGRTDAAGGALEQIRDSCVRLGRSPWGMLLHDEQALADWPIRWKSVFAKAQDEGLIRHAGVSVYSVEAALRALDLDGLDLIQVSGSLFDRRMLRADFFGKARQARKAVFVRSVYLQGLVGPAAADLPAAMAFAREALETLHGFCESNRISPRLLGLAYAARRFESALVALGAETESQAGDNPRSRQAAQSVPDDLLAAWDSRRPNDEMPLIDPRKWGMA